MKLKLIALSLLCLSAAASKAQRISPDVEKIKNKTLTIQPIMHATMVLSYDGKTVYVDPTGGAEAFKGLAAPDIILITDIHGDHLDPATIAAVNTANATFIVPQAVADKLPATIDKENVEVLDNGEKEKEMGIKFTAIPMYNLPEAPDAFHTKGRGNGYVLKIKNKNIYISGDTEDIPEMRSLKNIDIAFVCMNLPYTMDVNQAAQGVLALRPKVVYPYHYKGQDVNTFKSLVDAANMGIEVRLRNWYPAK
ncbi:MAG: beta-lactamase [Sphingobacteriaceae bacterium]|jgi:L-ascorbate metabolism protein UlaG (beta-lactamase superfamily)|nr:beta-lactamase [Sphingobacteriaceae bacterium]